MREKKRERKEEGKKEKVARQFKTKSQFFVGFLSCLTEPTSWILSYLLILLLNVNLSERNTPGESEIEWEREKNLVREKKKSEREGDWRAVFLPKKWATIVTLNFGLK